MSGRFQVLWRHRIVQVAIVYIGVSWGLFQGAAAVESTWGLPGWVDQATMLALVLGFAPTLMFAWSLSSARPASPEPAIKDGPVVRPRLTKGPATIAVLPFANLSREEADEIFADGMVEDLITGLSLNSSLVVMSRSSTFAYKGTSPDIREVAADLGVRFVLEGSVRRMGDRLRVTAQLIDSETGGHIWAEQFDRPQDDLFEIQDDLVMEIAAALGDAVNRAELTRARRNPNSVSAWEEAMRALIAQERPTVQTIPAALAHARRSVELDPNFALGYGRLAVSLITHAQLFGGEQAEKDRAEANRHIDRALALAPNDPKVLASACSAMAYSGRAEEAIRHGHRAIELNPNDAQIYGSLANAYFRAGRFAEALPYYEQEEILAPRSVFLNSRYIFRGLTHLALGQPAEAEAAFAKAAELDGAFESAWAGLAIVRTLRGNTGGAAAAIQRLRAVNPKATLETWNEVIRANVQGPGAEIAAACFKTAWEAAA